MQIGPYLHPRRTARVPGIWSLRILESELRCSRRYRPPPLIWRARAASRSKPSDARCSPLAIALTMNAKVANSSCLQLSSGFRSKKGIGAVARRTHMCGHPTADGSHGPIRNPGALVRCSRHSFEYILTNPELRYELPSASRARVPLDRYMKTSFSIYKTCYVRLQPFLLIDRT